MTLPGWETHLEEPAYLGREFPADPDPYDDFSRDRALGWMLILDVLLLLAALAYAGEGAWFLVLPCVLGAVLCSIGAFRRIRRAIRDEMNADPQETLRRHRARHR